jgi:hypothetical protein
MKRSASTPARPSRWLPTRPASSKKLGPSSHPPGRAWPPAAPPTTVRGEPSFITSGSGLSSSPPSTPFLVAAPVPPREMPSAPPRPDAAPSPTPALPAADPPHPSSGGRGYPCAHTILAPPVLGAVRRAHVPRGGPSADGGRTGLDATATSSLSVARPLATRAIQPQSSHRITPLRPSAGGRASHRASAAVRPGAHQARARHCGKRQASCDQAGPICVATGYGNRSPRRPASRRRPRGLARGRPRRLLPGQRGVRRQVSLRLPVRAALGSPPPRGRARPSLPQREVQGSRRRPAPHVELPSPVLFRAPDLPRLSPVRGAGPDGVGQWGPHRRHPHALASLRCDSAARQRGAGGAVVRLTGSAG